MGTSQRCIHMENKQVCMLDEMTIRMPYPPLFYPFFYNHFQTRLINKLFRIFNNAVLILMAIYLLLKIQYSSFRGFKMSIFICMHGITIITQQQILGSPTQSSARLASSADLLQTMYSIKMYSKVGISFFFIYIFCTCVCL